MTRQPLRPERWLRTAPLGRLYAWLLSLPGTMLYNTPAYKLHEELQLNPDNRVLDIGCGRGSLLQLVSSRVDLRRRPVGVDLSASLLHDAPKGKVEYVQASPEALPFAPESFDVVTCGYVAQGLDEQGLIALFREIRRVLAPGGIAVVWDFSPTRSGFLNRLHERVLSLMRGGTELRSYTALSAYALEAGFEWVSNAHLRPFLFPPIPRASVIVGKAPIGWKPEGVAEDLIPDTQARSLVARATRETLAPEDGRSSG